MLKKFGLEVSKPMKTPMSMETKPTKDVEVCSDGGGMAAGGGDGSDSGGGDTNGDGGGEGDLDLLRDVDGKSDGGGEDDDDKSDGGDVGISFPDRRM
ncbi:hypothetical protein Tco_0933254 [Tanacetum coccineum]